MQLLMGLKNGIGLSANQVGISQSFFIANFKDGFEIVINPEIIMHGKEEIVENEGCLSILDKKGKPIYKPKKRWAVITVSYLSFNGACNRTFKRLDARIFQHEMDHLNGKLCHNDYNK